MRGPGSSGCNCCNAACSIDRKCVGIKPAGCVVGADATSVGASDARRLRCAFCNCCAACCARLAALRASDS